MAFKSASANAQSFALSNYQRDRDQENTITIIVEMTEIEEFL